MDQEPKPANIRFLPTDGLEVPDWNPRKTMSVPGLAALKAHVEAGGTIPRIWVWGGDGKSVIAGQRRLTVYRQLGIPLIEAEIFHVSLEEAKRLARTSNRSEALNWLEEYESWENYFAPGSRLTDEAIGALEGVDSTWVRRARSLLAVLNPASRSLIRESLLEDPSKNKGNNGNPEPFRNVEKPLKKGPSKNEEKWGLLEKVAFPLASLWNKRTLQEAQALVEKTLPVILSREMSGPQVKALVKWVSAGNPPEAFGQAHLSPDPQVGGQASMGSIALGRDSGQRVVAPSQSGVGTGATKGGSVVNPSPLAGEGRVRGVSPVKAVGETGGGKGAKAGSTPNSQLLTSNSAKPDLHSQVATTIAGHELGKKLHIPSPLMNRLLPGLTRLFHRARGLFAGLGIKNPTLATLLTLVLFLFVGSTLINLTGRLMNRFWTGILYSWLSPSATRPTFQGQGGIGRIVSNSAPASQVVSGHLSPGPQAGGQALVVPSQSGGGTGATQTGSVQTKQAPNSSGNPTPAKGGDVLAQIGAGVKGYQSAVNTADQAKSATDRVKSLLGF